jgi:CRP/FNR family transcriptional regulator
MVQPLPILMHADNSLECRHRQPGWFCDLPPAALADYDAMSIHAAAGAGTRLFAEGEAARGVSILCCGRVKLTKSSPNGRTMLVRVATPGDVLGMSAALSQTPYEVTAETVEYSQVKTFRREDFLKFLEHHVEGGMNAARSLNREYRAALIDAGRLALSSSIAGRISHLLLQLAGENGTLDHAQPSVSVSLKHEELASMLGSSRESITRVLGELRRKGIISVEGDRVTILRKYALESLT